MKIITMKKSICIILIILLSWVAFEQHNKFSVKSAKFHDKLWNHENVTLIGNVYTQINTNLNTEEQLIYNLR